jgi:hypothetical protein
MAERPPGDYFTDGADFYRLVGWLGRWLEAMLAELRGLPVARHPA